MQSARNPEVSDGERLQSIQLGEGVLLDVAANYGESYPARVDRVNWDKGDADDLSEVATLIGDIVTDLLLWADDNGIPVDEVVRSAFGHFNDAAPTDAPEL